MGVGGDVDFSHEIGGVGLGEGGGEVGVGAWLLLLLLLLLRRMLLLLGLIVLLHSLYRSPIALLVVLSPARPRS